MLNDFLVAFNSSNDLFPLGFIAATILLYKIKNFSKRNLFLYFIFNFPFVLLHELSHYFVSLISLGKPISFSIIPKRVVNNKIILGEVGHLNVRFYNGFLIGLSPLLLLLLAYYFHLYYFDYMKYNLLLTFYIVYGLANSILSVSLSDNTLIQNSVI